jgi:alpha-N-arabinofuranosidase
MRDAVFSGITLDTFNRHPEKVGIACCAQLINCLNSLYLAHEEKFCVTPVGHVFAIYAAHQGGQGVRAEFSAPQISYERDGQTANFSGLRGSASLREKHLVVTAVNPDVSRPIEAEIVLHGGRANSATATVLNASDIHAANTFGQPYAVVPTKENLHLRDGNVRFRFPAASVAKLEIELG